MTIPATTNPYDVVPKTRKLIGWEGWNTIAMALYRATGGSDAGYEIFHTWCAKNKTKFNEKYTHYTWYVRFRRSPPTSVGAGTLFAIAEYEQPGWQNVWDHEQHVRQLEKEDAILNHDAAAIEHDSPKTNGAAPGDNEHKADDGTDQSKTNSTKSKPPKIKATPFQWIDSTKIRLRDWLYRPYYIRQFVSQTVSTGGVGKTTLVITEMLAMVSGKDLLNVSTEGELLRVWYWNGEDPTDELQRRFAAAIKHHNLTPDDIGDRLFLDSGRKMRIVIADEDKSGVKLDMEAIEAIIATLKANKIDVLIIDPHIASHRVSENNNTGIERVAKAWGYIAEVADCAIMLAHHTRKTINGAGVTTDDGRGASALRDAVRAARSLNNMTKEEADNAGIDPSQRGYYFRSDNGKANLTPPAERADWFKLVSVDLENNIVPGIPGDEIGVVTAWEYPTIETNSVTAADIKRAQDAIAAGGPWRRDQRSTPWVGLAIAQAFNVDISESAKLKRQNKKAIEKRIELWVLKGLLVIETRVDPTVKNHKPVDFVIVGRPPIAADAEGF